ncbi:helix-turn-helix domain-containing protein [Paraburkholderia bannensis]|uniref:helix-turn-helix domain-containing protein n=1 Tax=Paraburkholderia bannensis TaxID=765414 RepID=UPI002AC3223A|nr:helix-turn-helix transcriptional regulator [Paraburkholderia bannensis]
MVTQQSAPNYRELFGVRLRALRISAGFSQEELAHRAGLDRTYVSSCERGRRNLSLESIVTLAIALGVKPSELLVGVEQVGDEI